MLVKSNLNYYSGWKHQFLPNMVDRINPQLVSQDRDTWKKIGLTINGLLIL
jgi:hypothetical protein